MKTSLQLYLEDTKRHLLEYSTEEDKGLYVLYEYSYEKDILPNSDYFKTCLDAGLSTYKALLYLGDYIKDIK